MVTVCRQPWINSRSSILHKLQTVSEPRPQFSRFHCSQMNTDSRHNVKSVFKWWTILLYTYSYMQENGLIVDGRPERFIINMSNDGWDVQQQQQLQKNPTENLSMRKIAVKARRQRWILSEKCSLDDIYLQSIIHNIMYVWAHAAYDVFAVNWIRHLIYRSNTVHCGVLELWMGQQRQLHANSSKFLFREHPSHHWYFFFKYILHSLIPSEDWRLFISSIWLYWRWMKYT